MAGGLHKGAREQGVDYFDDFTATVDKEKGGILGGMGRDYFEGVHEELTNQGLCIRSQCRVCGVEKNVTLDWKEMFIVGENGPGVAPVLPEGWEYSANNSAAFPRVPCNSCGEGVFAPMLTPEEAVGYVKQGIGQGFIPQHMLQQWQSEVQAYRARR